MRTAATSRRDVLINRIGMMGACVPHGVACPILTAVSDLCPGENSHFRQPHHENLCGNATGGRPLMQAFLKERDRDDDT